MTIDELAALRTATSAVEACDGDGEPKKVTHAERVALAQAYATLAVAEQLAEVVGALGHVEQRLDGIEDAVGRCGR